MDGFNVVFAISGVKTNIFIPPLIAFVVSFFTSMGGISGAFMLLPFQMNFLNYTAPSVSGTNQFFNMVAIPSSVWQYVKEKRMVWPLTWAVIIGTLPGVIVGAYIRIEYLPDPRHFKFFVGLVLSYVGIRLFNDVIKHVKNMQSPRKRNSLKDPTDLTVSETGFSLKRIKFKFDGVSYSFSFLSVFALCLVVGIIGGVYGIGGGSIIAPFFVTFFQIPVYVVAGAALMGTFVTSIAGVIVYQVLSCFYLGVSVSPDWSLGFLFGIGGFCGMYFGARCQKYVPAYLIKCILCFCVLLVAGGYIWGFIRPIWTL
ncbi:MAG: sulfite exporter TauE/SafE family protein [Desulfobacteraceae bacterium]|nr:sulfite exporter TauE/SafE family protein [Desulfobacteraceae bacterium]